MFIQLRKHGAELQHESAVVPCQMNGALKDFSRWPTLISVITLEPVLGFHGLWCLLFGLSRFLALGEEIVLLNLLGLRLSCHLAKVIVAVLAFCFLLPTSLSRII